MTESTSIVKILIQFFKIQFKSITIHDSFIKLKIFQKSNIYHEYSLHHQQLLLDVSQ